MILAPDESSQKAATGLLVKNAGKYGDHAVARKAGVRPDDKIISIAGVSTEATEAEVIAAVLNSTKKGEAVTIKVRRSGKEMELSYKTQ